MSPVCKSVYLGIALSLLAGCQALDHPIKAGNSIEAHEPPTRLFLQQITATSAIIKWRGAGNKACFSTRMDNLPNASCVAAQLETAANGSSHKIANLNGLQPDTKYFYTVNGTASKEQYFHTASRTGSPPKDGNTHIWIIGDSGTATERSSVTRGGTGEVAHPGAAAQVRDGFLKYNAAQGNEPLDLFLLLGDNAYMEGSDSQWQGALFEIYPDILNKVAVWPTIGNHEMGGARIPSYGAVGGVSISADPASYDDLDDTTVDRGMPYLDIFSLPTHGEAGGVSSGTEQYYSADYGNVHIVSLDSQLSARDTTLRKAMRDWLIRDLSANTLDWTIVIFHHPPYSRSSHDSDSGPASVSGIDQPMIDMRVEFTPVFEQYGVDMVFNGHSHSYERSGYLHGHTGDTASFDPALHAELNSTGNLATGSNKESYSRITSSGSDDKVVYTVAGSSGKVSLHRGMRGIGKLDHPAHITFPDGRHGLEMKGSVVVDASRRELRSTFIDEQGVVHDQFVIAR